MRVKAGEYVKEIPAEYAAGAELLTLSDWEKPEKIRLTPLERFRFAEAAFRMTLFEDDPYVFEHLTGEKPQYVEVQMNRWGMIRYVIRYSDIKGVICPARIGKLCPDKRERNQNFSE